MPLYEMSFNQNHDVTVALVLGKISAGLPETEPVFDRCRAFEYPAVFYRPGGVAFEVEGYSMDDGTESAITPGRLVLVDPNDCYTNYGKVYAFITPDGRIVVKRLVLKKGRRTLLSDNTDYAPITNLREFRMIGCVYAHQHRDGVYRSTH